MTTHVEAPVASEHTVEHHPDTLDHSLAVPGLRFEKCELQEFVSDDRHAGNAIGKLLAFVFFLSLCLMVGVTWWTFRNHYQGHNPQAGIGAAATEHH